MRIFDFLNILVLLTIFTGIVTFVDWILRRKNSASHDERKYSIFVEYARSFFPVFLIVMLIRAFIFQPYRVPTGSLEPTVMPGDLIFVTQFNYGLKIPLWDKSIINIGHPERGQIALFRWPVNPKLTFVKRVIGVPGDHISYNNKVFTINGVEATQSFVGNFKEDLGNGQFRPVKRYLENLNGIKHYILVNPEVPATNFNHLVVPEGMFMMVGDNRDDSDDSRDWGFVSEQSFVLRALFVWFNIQFSPFSINWHRIGNKLFATHTARDGMQ